jgi:hypothetical protein
MRQHNSLLFLLPFIGSNFFTRVMIPLMLSSISSVLFSIRLTLLVPSCLLSLISHARIRRPLLSFVTHMTSLTRLRDEFEPLRAQLLPHHPCVSLMDALAEVRNEETHLQDAGPLVGFFYLGCTFFGCSSWCSHATDLSSGCSVCCSWCQY